MRAPATTTPRGGLTPGPTRAGRGARARGDVGRAGARAPRRPEGPGSRRPRGTAPRARLGWRAGGWSVTLAVAAALGGCAPAVQVPAAPYADDPACAEVLLALPAVLAEAERIDTTSQGTAAWAHDRPQDAIVLRCGVEPLPPTPERCVTATDDAGTSVDWVTVPGDDDAGTPWTFTTYGRVPAVELLVPTSVTSERSTSFLVDLGSAVSRVEPTRSCL